MNHKLAIVIPAYKISFFKQSIESIANQTCKEFTLYIGDDASPASFGDIIDIYRDKIDIVYKRFDENLGGKNLVDHWNRCIDMTQGEEWIWLFSDDDIMNEKCVSLFYDHINKYENDSLLHFDIQVINDMGDNIFKTKEFAPHYSSAEYFSKTITGKVYSCVIEYIFKRKDFENINRFENFDLAWSSDTATWMKLALHNGVTTISGAKIKWRLSTVNISAISNDKSITLRKINACVNYLNWAKLFFDQNNLKDLTSGVEKIRWLMGTIVYTSALNYREKYLLIKQSLEKLKLNNIKFSVLMFWIYEEFKRNVKSAISYKG